MTPTSISSANAVTSAQRTGATAPGNERPSVTVTQSSATGSPARPSAVVNLKTSANQAALNSLTYGNLRGNANASQATGSPTAGQGSTQTQANSPANNTTTSQSQVRAQSNQAAQEATQESQETDQATQSQETDRQGAQAAQATSFSRQAFAEAPAA